MRRSFLAFCFVALSGARALAWGDLGHKATAQVTLAYLTPSAQAAVTELLGSTDQFVEASAWADRVRPYRRESRPWHFVNIPLESGIYDPDQHCRNGDCVIAKINESSKVIADARVDKSLRPKR
jgi:hypothetical protein